MDKHKSFRDLDGLFQRIFDHVGGLFHTLEIDLGPQTAIVESDCAPPWPVVRINTMGESAVVQVELAGFSKEDLTLDAEGSIITISGERDDIGFTKTFQVDTERFDVDSLKAGHKNGLLTITLDRVKAEPRIEKRPITIQ